MPVELIAGPPAVFAENAAWARPGPPSPTREIAIVAPYAMTPATPLAGAPVSATTVATFVAPS